MSHSSVPARHAICGEDASALNIQTVLADRTRVHLQLSGALDLATADDLADVLEGHLVGGRRIVRLDLSELQFLDCAGLRILLRARKQCLARDGTLILTHVGPRPARLLDLTGWTALAAAARLE
jgi:anti-anti-sigma factor